MSGKSRFSLVRPHCAGVDLGSAEHYVAAPEGSGADEVRRFGCFTADLTAMGSWLLELGVKDVAMEATGVYWIPVYESLASRGLKVSLVDGRAAQALPGRKTDVQDCQWIRDLHMHGLLQPCVVPEADILVLRSYWRQHERLVAQRAEQIQLMHKALEQMNIQIHKVLTDVSGVSGMAIIRAILSGERDPQVLGSLLAGRAKLKKDLVAKALEGRLAAHHLLALEQAVQSYDFLGSLLAKCDRCLDDEMSRLGGGPAGSPPSKRTRKNELTFDVQTHISLLLGVDPTTINGLGASLAASLLCELGTDLSRFKTEKHFVSYLGLAPANRITGGRIKGSRTRKVNHPASKVFRMAANSLHHSRSAIGANFRRLCARIGPAKATTAIARKIAIQYYRLLSGKEPYVDVGEEAYQERFREQSLKRLQKQAHKLGMQLVQAATP